jgi:hypothetical protein
MDVDERRCKMAPDIIKYYQWLISEIGNQTSYHSHKETMAWSATALYVPGVIALGFFSSANMANITACWRVGLATSIILLLSVLVGVFVYRQFELQLVAAKTVEALIKLVNDFCSLDSAGAQKVVAECQIEKDKIWPKFVQEKIDDATGRSFATKLFTNGASLLTIGLATLFAIILVWFVR